MTFRYLDGPMPFHQLDSETSDGDGQARQLFGFTSRLLGSQCTRTMIQHCSDSRHSVKACGFPSHGMTVRLSPHLNLSHQGRGEGGLGKPAPILTPLDSPFSRE